MGKSKNSIATIKKERKKKKKKKQNAIQSLAKISSVLSFTLTPRFARS